jgi:cell division protein FtsA
LLVGNTVKHTAVLSVGGHHITNDLAFGLHLPALEAERIKKAHGCAYRALIEPLAGVDMQHTGNRLRHKLTCAELCDIIEPRVEEMLHMVRREIVRSGYAESMTAGVVLTGGTALLQGIVELAEHVFRMPVRRGLPTGITGLVELVQEPMYATGVGLVQFGTRQYPYGGFHKFNDEHLFAKVYHRMRDWFSEFLS